MVRHFRAKHEDNSLPFLFPDSCFLSSLPCFLFPAFAKEKDARIMHGDLQRSVQLLLTLTHGNQKGARSGTRREERIRVEKDVGCGADADAAATVQVTIGSGELEWKLERIPPLADLPLRCA